MHLNIYLLVVFYIFVKTHSAAQAINATTNVAAYAINATTMNSINGNVPKRLIDGNTDPNFFHGFCSAAYSSDPKNLYFRIHLDNFYQIGRVVVYNRMDCCSNRADYLIVRLANFSSGIDDSISPNNYPLCGVYPNKAEAVYILTINCDTNLSPVNNIIIQANSSQESLNLCEVEAFVKIDGNWGVWGDWSQAAISCGQSTTVSRTRACNDPAPANNGIDCQGNNTETMEISLQPCQIDIDCPTQFTYNEDNKKCYYLITVKQNWENQRNFCNGMLSSAHLVMPTSHQDFEDITSFLNSIDYQIKNKCTDRATGMTLIWTAGQKNNDQFVWKPFEYGEINPNFPYDSSAWIEGAPDNFANSEYCVHLVNTDDGYRLNDIACSSTCNVDYNKKYKNFGKMCGVCEVELMNHK